MVNIQWLCVEGGDLEAPCYQHSDQPPFKMPVNFVYDVINFAHDLCAASFPPGAAGAGCGPQDLLVEVSSFRPGTWRM